MKLDNELVPKWDLTANYMIYEFVEYCSQLEFCFSIGIVFYCLKPRIEVIFAFDLFQCILRLLKFCAT